MPASDFAIDWYDQWVYLHCTQFGQAEHGTVFESLRANRETLVDRLHATGADLAEVTMRIAASGAPLRWPNEHLPEVVKAIRDLRAERAAEQREPPAEHAEVRCGPCGDSGWVVVPHPACVWQGRVVAKRGCRGVFTVAVTCSRCEKGLAMQAGERRREAEQGDRGKGHPRRLSEQEHMGLIGGHDGHDLYARYLAERAEDARAGAPPGGGLLDLLPGLRSLLRGKSF